MARLLDLANELLLGIITVVRVEDIESFTSCNKRLYILSGGILKKHRAMKKKYSTIQLTSSDADNWNVRFSVHPVVWLHEVTLHKAAALYPTRLHIRDNIRPSYEVYGRYSSGISPETKESIYSKLDQCPYIPREELERWKKDIDSRQRISFDVALALLLTSLPNLQSISTEGLSQLPDCTEKMVHQIAKAQQVDNEQVQALSHLTSLHQNGKYLDPRNNSSMGLCLPFTGLPSFRSVSGDFIHGPTWDVFEDPKLVSKIFKSGITSIKFTESRISNLDLEPLLCRTSALQNFKYEDDCGHYGHFQYSEVVNSLLAHAAHSLCCLDLTTKNVNTSPTGWNDYWSEVYGDSENAKAPLHCYFFMGSLRPFQVLKTVKVDGAMFIEQVFNADTDGKDLSRVHRLVDMLPASIEKLSLVARLGPRSSNRIFDGLVESKADVLPKLEEIKFERSDPVGHDLKGACHGIGVELVTVTTL